MVASDCFVSVVAPLYNDSAIVESFILDIVKTLRNNYAHYEVVLIDDGSNDDTVDKVNGMLSKYECIRLIRLSRTFGQEIAISAGIDSVIGDFAVIMLPDSDPPELVPHIVEQSRDGSGIVFGIRKHRAKEPLLLKGGASLFYWFSHRILKLNIPKNTTHFRVLSRKSINALIQMKDRLRYLQTLSAYVGYSNQSFVYEPLERRARPRKKSIWEALNLAINIIVTNSTFPLRLVSWLGLAVSALNLLYIGYVVLNFFFNDHLAEGWVTRSLQNSVMHFFLFLILAVLSEYIGRLLNESKDRPLYYVLDELNSSVMIADEDRKNVVMETLEENTQ